LIDNVERERGKRMLGMMTVRVCAAVLIGIALLMAACTNTPPEANAVVTAYSSPKLCRFLAISRESGRCFA
jgi:hypothetical protein